MKSVFVKEDVNELLSRIHQLTPTSTPQWGKMNVGQMLAHCNVTYEMIYENIHPKPNGMVRLILKLLVKTQVVNEKPYPHNSRTAPAFIIKSEKEIDNERKRLIDYIQQTLQLGESYFEGKESLSFGKLSAKEWNNMLYKHLDHHLRQFGV